MAIDTVATGVGVSTTHPEYTERSADWEMMRDTVAGERVVKSKNTKYLPATSGMITDGMGHNNALGQKAYDAYRTRSVFPDIVSDGVEAMLGVMHNKPAVIELPAAMEPMRNDATLRHESLLQLLRRINEEQLITGRVGLLLDLPERVSGANVLPYIATYQGEKILNWDEGRRDGIVVDNLNLVVLDESAQERTANFSWSFVQKYRILALGELDVDTDGDGFVENLASGQGVYRQTVVRETNGQSNFNDMVIPSIKGKTLSKIPFVFINASDVVPETDKPPLLGLARIALAIYRGEADYRQALFMQGQDTLVVVGAAEDNFRVGANATITLPIGGSAEYIGPSSSGLAEMRTALENDKAAAASKGVQLLDTVSRERESGEALQVRVAARTATLNQLALAGAFGLENLLKQVAEWIGVNPDEVVVKPNLEFSRERLGGRELTELQTAKTLGAPLSDRSIHGIMQDRGLTKLEFEEEIAIIQAEVPLVDEGSDDVEGPEDS